MSAVDEVERVKTAVSHCDRTLSEMMLMTLLLKCEARVITVPSLKAKAKAVAAEENTKQSGGEESVGGCWSSQIQNTTPTLQMSRVVSINLSIYLYNL